MLGVLACLAARRKDDGGAAPRRSLLNSGAVGPLTGGILLVTISGFISLGAPTPVVYAVLLVAAVGMIAIRVVVPPLSVFVKRALVSPFVMVAGGLYWTVIESVVGTPGVAAVRRTALVDPHQAEFALFFLLAFSAVYYAMLVYAPRQIRGVDGRLLVLVRRYAAFVVSIALGIGWLSILSS